MWEIFVAVTLFLSLYVAYQKFFKINYIKKLNTKTGMERENTVETLFAIKDGLLMMTFFSILAFVAVFLLMQLGVLSISVGHIFKWLIFITLVSLFFSHDIDELLILER